MDAMELHDEELVGLCRAGEDRAFSQIYGRYQHRVMRTAFRILKNAEEAQDATQEIFYKAYRSLPEWDPARSKLSTWLYRLAANHAVDCYRMRSRRLRHLASEDFGEGADINLRYPDAVPAPDSHLESREIATELRRCIHALPGLQKRLFVLRYLHGYKLEQIAGMERRSLGTVKGLLHRATRTMRSRLKSRRPC